MRRLFSLVLLALLLLITPIVSAVESNGVGGRPANPKEENPRTKSIFVYDLKSGQSVNDAVAIYNNSDSKKTVAVYATDSLISSDGAFGCRQEVEPKKEVGSWIKVSSGQIEVPAGGNAEVPFTLQVPDDTPAGEYNACVAIQDRTTAPQKSGNGISLNFRSAIRVAVTVPGEINEQLTLKSSLLEVKEDKLTVSPILKNDGNVSLDSKLSVKVKTLIGTTVDQVEGEFPVLARTEARFNFDLTRPFWGGFYWQETNASYKRLSIKNAKVTEVPGIKQLRFIAPKPVALVIEVILLLVLASTMKYLLDKRKANKKLRDQLVEYRVKNGEHLEDIASKHQIEWKKLASINKIKAPYKVHKDQLIMVPRITATKAKEITTPESNEPAKTTTTKPKSKEATKKSQTPPTKKTKAKGQKSTSAKVTSKKAKKTSKKSPKKSQDKKQTKPKASTKKTKEE